MNNNSKSRYDLLNVENSVKIREQSRRKSLYELRREHTEKIREQRRKTLCELRGEHKRLFSSVRIKEQSRRKSLCELRMEHKRLFSYENMNYEKDCTDPEENGICSSKFDRSNTDAIHTIDESESEHGSKQSYAIKLTSQTILFDLNLAIFQFEN